MKVEKPTLWICMGLLVLVIIDALLEIILGKSLMTDKHWIVLRLLGISLSILVTYQCCRLESLLEA
jgi:hypothetical protein